MWKTSPPDESKSGKRGAQIKPRQLQSDETRTKKDETEEKNKLGQCKGQARSTAGEILVSAHVVRVGLAQEPTVQHLVEVVEVVLSIAVTLVLGSRRLLDGKAERPTVVLADSLEHVATALVQGVLKVLCTRVDVEPRVFAVAVGSAAALVGGDLHETLLAVATGDVGVAGGLLHGKRHEDGSGNAVRLFSSLEGPENILAGSKDGRVGGLGARDDLELVELEVGGLPSTGSETAVEEALGAVGLLVVGAAGTAFAGVVAKETSAGCRGRR